MVDAGEQISFGEYPNTTHSFRRAKQEWKTPDITHQAAAFCSNMLKRDAPEQFYRAVITELSDWGLLPDALDETYSDYETYRSIVWNARENLENPPSDFAHRFIQSRYKQQHGIEAPYDNQELSHMYEVGKALVNHGYSDSVEIRYHITSGGDILHILVPLATEHINERAVIRSLIKPPHRAVQRIRDDLLALPKVLPQTDVAVIHRNQLVLLSQWIDGRSPKTIEEKQHAVRAAQELLRIPALSYDFNLTNFLVTELDSVFYVDGDMLYDIVRKGYSDVDDQRRELFERAVGEMY